MTCPAGDLAPGATVDCTATYLVTQADLDAGCVTNDRDRATADGIDSNEDSVTVAAAQGPDLEARQDPDAGHLQRRRSGHHATTYVVTNTGNVTLAGPFSVADDKVTVDLPCGRHRWPRTTIVTCTATYTITQADLDAGSVTNTASASADGATSPEVTATVTAPPRARR